MDRLLYTSPIYFNFLFNTLFLLKKIKKIKKKKEEKKRRNKITRATL